jgi:hypothetical protein
MSHGLFGREARDVARPRPSPAEAAFLRELAEAAEATPERAVADLMQLTPPALFDGFRKLGASLRATSPSGLIGCLGEIARNHHDNSLLAEAGVGHGALAGADTRVPAASLAWLG